MAKTKVKSDIHGIYVRGGGYIWRYDFPRGYKHVHGLVSSRHTEGDSVNVSHSGGPLASISGEKWYAHGSYYYDRGSGHKPSWSCYRPSHDLW